MILNTLYMPTRSSSRPSHGRSNTSRPMHKPPAHPISHTTQHNEKRTAALSTASTGTASTVTASTGSTIFGNIASTAAGVTIGNVISTTMMGGHKSSTQVEQYYSTLGGACDKDMQAYVDCTKNSSNCDAYLNQFKTCVETYRRC